MKTDSEGPERKRPPPLAIAVPFAFLLHLAEEWFGDFSAWTANVLGNEVSPTRFVAINTIGLVVFLAGTLASFRYPSTTWLIAAFAALFSVNAALHTAATIGFGTYSPGTLTGLVVYAPLSILLLRWAGKSLSHHLFVRAIWTGVILHALVSFVAFV